MNNAIGMFLRLLEGLKCIEELYREFFKKNLQDKFRLC
jgi:hypothetical protein